MSESNTLPEDGGNLDHKMPGALPDTAICRAKRVGSTVELADCLVENPYRCPYALGFAYGHLCRHPEREEIIARTEAIQRKQ